MGSLVQVRDQYRPAGGQPLDPLSDLVDRVPVGGQRSRTFVSVSVAGGQALQKRASALHGNPETVEYPDLLRKS